jgi:hypothetical protein
VRIPTKARESVPPALLVPGPEKTWATFNQCACLPPPSHTPWEFSESGAIRVEIS